jgi:DNA-binding transcriptional ArsR family regulator
MTRINSSGAESYPDYELADRRVLSDPREIRALTHPLRAQLLELVLERAASVTELAAALGRPKSTVSHHVNVLLAADLLTVVRTRRVRAIDERFYGRTARLFAMGQIDLDADAPPPWGHPLMEAARESHDAYVNDTLWANGRHVRISRDQAREFWARVELLLSEFAQLPRAGDTVFGLAVGLYPTTFPALPDGDDAPAPGQR